MRIAYLLLALSSGCASTSVVQHLKGAPPLGRSEATLEVTMENATNTRIELHADHMLRPAFIGAKTYVAWAIPLDLTQQPPQKIGNFTTDAEAHGKLHATVPMTDFWIIITAERTTDGTAPEGPTLFSAEIRRVAS